MNKIANVRQMYVFLSSDEYGSDTMSRIAEKYLRADKNKDVPLVVTVNEHAGWRLDFALIGDKVHTIGSANGSSVFPKDVEEFRAAIYHAKWDVIESGLRRDNDDNLVPFDSLYNGDKFDYCGLICMKCNEDEYRIDGVDKLTKMEKHHSGRSKNVIKIV